MKSPPDENRKISIDLRNLERPIDKIAWLAYVQSALVELGLSAKLEVFGCEPLVLSHHRLRASSENLPTEQETFAMVTGSEVLSRKLLQQFGRLHLCPSAPPHELDCHLYFMALEGRRFSTRLRQTASACGIGTAEAEAVLCAMKPSRRTVALISSVYDGDRYLDSFLDNYRQLDGYETMRTLSDQA